MSPNGIYAVNFYTLGIPHTVIVDDYIPMANYQDGTYYTIFSKVGLDDSVWTPVLEKAFAKVNGNYNHIQGGNPRVAARTLSGAPYDTFQHSDYTEDDIWTEL